MKTTPNLGLKKPDQEDFYNVDDFNYNADKLDEEVAQRITNAGGVPSIQAGLDASKPTPGTAGRLYVATDTQMIYRDTGAIWQKVGAVKWDDIEGKPDLALAADLAAHLAESMQQGVHKLFTTADVTYYVDSINGKDNNPGTTPDKPFKTIAKAVSMIPPFVRHATNIYIADGEYDEPLFLSNIITFGRGNVEFHLGNNVVLKGTTSAGYLLAGMTTSIALYNVIGRIYVNQGKFVIKPGDLGNLPYCGIAAMGSILSSIAPFIFSVNGDDVITTKDKYGIYSIASILHVAYSDISKMNIGVYASYNSKIHSRENTGTDNNIGLRAVRGAVISKEGTQPSGTTAESTYVGGVIR